MTGLVGPVTRAEGVALTQFRFGHDNSLVVQDGRSRYAEPTSRLKGFSATNAATSQACSTLLSTTYVGLCVSNPVGSGYNLELVNFAVVNDGTVSGAIGGFAIGGGGSSAGVTVHGTPLAALWGPTLLGPAPGSVASSGACAGSVAAVDSACTLVGAPRCVMNVTGGAFTTAPTSGAACNVDVGGSIVVAPGGYVCGIALIASMTHFLYSFGWIETVQ